MGHDDAARVQFERRAQWRSWLRRNHATSTGVWVVYAKKGASVPSPTYEELVLEALCFGWIDSVARKVDDELVRLWFCPRKKGSVWAATNKARIQSLVADGLMTPAGLAVIDAAKADGSWTTIDAAEAAEVPPDLEKAFSAYPGSEEKFAAFPTSARKAILQWIALAKRPETRAKRVDETARLAQNDLRANQWAPKST